MLNELSKPLKAIFIVSNKNCNENSQSQLMDYKDQLRDNIVSNVFSLRASFHLNICDSCEAFSKEILLFLRKRIFVRKDCFRWQNEVTKPRK